MKTVEDFTNNYIDLNSIHNYTKKEIIDDMKLAMIAFAKYHYKSQAEAIYQTGLSNLTEWQGNPYSGEGSDELNLKLIQEVYPITNIK